MKTVAKSSKRFFNVLFIASLILGCSKEETPIDQTPQGTFLTFTTVSNGKQNNTVLYSKWIPSQFPNSSQNSSEVFSLPLINSKFLNLEKDVILVYGKRNNIFSLPVTMPQDAESYIVELIKVANGTSTRLRVTSLLLDPLQDIFFRPSANAEFRVVIVPGEKLFGLSSKGPSDLGKMTYREIVEHFSIPQ